MCNRIGTIVKVKGREMTAIKMTCRSWNCSSCVHDRKRQLIAEVRQGNPQRLLTLTVNPHWFDSPEERAAKLVYAWRMIRRRFFKRHPNATCEFLAVFEKTKLGEPHLHIVQRGAFMSQKWLSIQLEELIGAKIVDIRFVRSAKAVANYVSKYIGKEPHQFGTLKRYWRSLKFLPMSKAAARKLRNAGCAFYIMDVHWKPYFRACMRSHEVSGIQGLKRGFTAFLEYDGPPPWCLNTDPIICE